jgi:hypothetical protein
MNNHRKILQTLMWSIFYIIRINSVSNIVCHYVIKWFVVMIWQQWRYKSWDLAPRSDHLNPGTISRMWCKQEWSVRTSTEQRGDGRPWFARRYMVWEMHITSPLCLLYATASHYVRCTQQAAWFTGPPRLIHRGRGKTILPQSCPLL